MNPRLLCSLVLLCLFISSWRVSAQPTNVVYAATGSSSNVTEPTWAAANDGNKTAELTAERLAVLSNDAYLDLSFAADLSTTPVAKTLYIRVASSSSAFNTNAIKITAHNATSEVSLTGGSYQTYITPDGNAYLAVTPTAAYRRVRVTLDPPAVVGTYKLRIYDAFYSPDALNTSNPYPFSASDCGAPNVTSRAVSNSSLSVSNANGAIDSDLGTSSSFVSGLVNLGSGTVKQVFHFNGPSNEGDGIRVIVSKTSGVAQVKLSESVSLTAYNGTQVVGSAVPMSTLLAADLLGLLGDNSAVAFYLKPTGTFDRVEVTLDMSLLAVNLAGTLLNIHDVRRAPAVPTSVDKTVCTNIGSVALIASNIQSSIASLAYNWYSELRGISSLASASQLNLSNLTTVGEKTYYVEATKAGTGCIPSDRFAVKVTTVNPPVVPGVSLAP